MNLGLRTVKRTIEPLRYCPGVRFAVLGQAVLFHTVMGAVILIVVFSSRSVSPPRRNNARRVDDNSTQPVSNLIGFFETEPNDAESKPVSVLVHACLLVFCATEPSRRVDCSISPLPAASRWKNSVKFRFQMHTLQTRTLFLDIVSPIHATHGSHEYQFF